MIHDLCLFGLVRHQQPRGASNINVTIPGIREKSRWRGHAARNGKISLHAESFLTVRFVFISNWAVGRAIRFTPPLQQTRRCYRVRGIAPIPRAATCRPHVIILSQRRRTEHRSSGSAGICLCISLITYLRRRCDLFQRRPYSLR